MQDNYLLESGYGDIPNIIVLSETEIALGIWVFKCDKASNTCTLKSIYKDGFLKLITRLGYYKRYNPGSNSFLIIKDDSGIIHESTTARIKDDLQESGSILFNDLLFDYEYAESHRFHIDVPGEKLKEVYLNNYHNILNENFLEHLPVHDKPLLSDTMDHTYILFKNHIVDVSSEEPVLIQYTQLGDRCVWRDHILEREFKYVEADTNSKFYQFGVNVTAGDPHRFRSLQTTIGYLINNHNDPANARAVIFYDEEVTDLKTPQGGTGKGVLANAIGQVRNVVRLDGKKFNGNSAFVFQRVSLTTQIIWLDDVPSGLKFEFFHSMITEGIITERKHKEECKIPFEDSPKFLISSNSVILGEGNTNERRQHIFEFAPFYSKLQREGISEPLIQKHGCRFFDDKAWNAEEWNKFYSFLVDCCKKYHKDGLVSLEPINVGRNKLLQTTCIEFIEWMEDGELEADFEYNLKAQFKRFKEANGMEDMKQRQFTIYLKTYALSNGHEWNTRNSDGEKYFTIKTVNK